MVRRIDRNFARAAALALAGALALGAAPAPQAARAARPARATAVAVFAGGCFWGMEEVFEQLRGVDDVVSGYAGGTRETATYETVSSGTTGHAESVRIAYDPARISYARLLDVYFTVAHDPTQRDRQGPDTGTQYRSEIFYGDETQRRAALAAIARLQRERAYPAPIVTVVAPLRAFYPAEAYHQRFALRHPDHPYIVEVDAPKVAALRKRFPALVKT